MLFVCEPDVVFSVCTPHPFMCPRVRFVSPWILRGTPQLLAESTSHWSPIKPSERCRYGVRGLLFFFLPFPALRLPVITHQEITALCSSRSLPAPKHTHGSYYTICKTLHQCGTYLNTEPGDNLWHFKHRGTVGVIVLQQALSAELAARVLERSDNARCRCHMGS